jgi:hypothetical protein
MKIVHINTAQTVKEDTCKIVKLYPQRATIMTAVRNKFQQSPGLLA